MGNRKKLTLAKARDRDLDGVLALCSCWLSVPMAVGAIHQGVTLEEAVTALRRK